MGVRRRLALGVELGFLGVCADPRWTILANNSESGGISSREDETEEEEEEEEGCGDKVNQINDSG